MFTTQFNHETLRHRSAAAPPRGIEHLIEYRTMHPPSPRRRLDVRRLMAGGLARTARRLDGEAARRAIA
ncbi:hypothetical protein [Capillimicrobium parvum]|uniref:Uncharacterized protein n=1 Tax=Capillimicrobium parvum TaxID=2884022 RepID=A0A9E7BZY1_9ACTN|nr:hypothetical protein [Capillimicrobium parvum]UGS35054.1 hypothetical protein DSM104329_01438 [Capillimicrobium parvum]